MRPAPPVTDLTEKPCWCFLNTIYSTHHTAYGRRKEMFKGKENVWKCSQVKIGGAISKRLSTYFRCFSRCWVSAEIWNCFLESKSHSRPTSTLSASVCAGARQGSAGASLKAEPDTTPERSLIARWTDCGIRFPCVRNSKTGAHKTWPDFGMSTYLRIFSITASELQHSQITESLFLQI